MGWRVSSAMEEKLRLVFEYEREVQTASHAQAGSEPG
jgi:hypothetical protein